MGQIEILCPKIILNLKIFGEKKFGFKKIVGIKKVLVKKYFGLDKTFYLQKKLWVRVIRLLVLVRLV